MKKSMIKMVALVLALMLVLSTGALAAEKASDAYRVPGVRPRPEGQEATQTDEDEVVDSVEPEPSEEPVEPEPSEEPAKDKVEIEDAENGYLNVRSGPSMDASVIGKLKYGEEVEILSDEGEWCKVRLADGTVGYVASRYLAGKKTEQAEEPAEGDQTEGEDSEDLTESGNIAESEHVADPNEEQTEVPSADPTEEPTEEQAGETEVEEAPVKAANPINIRKEPDGLSEIIYTTTADDEITVLEIVGKWVKVSVGGVVGYAYIDDIPGLQPQEPEIDPENPPAVEVEIFSDRRSAMNMGEKVTLTSKISNLEYYSDHLLQWQCDKGNGFEDVSGATGESYSFEASIETLGYDWKLIVYYR